MIEEETGNGIPTERTALSDEDFRTQLAAVIPQLRAFGRSLSGNRDTGDDLVQETLLKAWAARDRYEAGTNLRAWTFIILRNLFLSQMRRNRFRGEWDDLVAVMKMTGTENSARMSLTASIPELSSAS